ncbi:MAG TPA: ribonuclease P protein component [Candidatus Sulfotelmatobacter sp.]|nr:ribonuclease P protein component [Candidatus Sulfotelmatobacter sp.]
MLNRRHRFHGYGSLKRVYANSTSVRGQYLSLRYGQRKNRPYRVAVVVAKKVNKSAVKRNRIRRRIYEIVRQYNLKDEIDYIITVYGDQVAEMPADELKNQVESLLAKVH